MSLNIISLLCFAFCIPVFVVLLYAYSVYVVRNDFELKSMLNETVFHGEDMRSDTAFVLEKSFAAICFMCILPLSSVGFLSSLLFFDHSFWKTVGYVFAFSMTTLGFVSAFCDYFLSMIVIVKRRMYIRCVKTLFRPAIVTLDGRYHYEDVPVGGFGFYGMRYVASISMPSGSYVVMNVNNKRKLRDVLNRINAAPVVAEEQETVSVLGS